VFYPGLGQEKNGLHNNLKEGMDNMSREPLRLKDKVIIVTGGAQGIGRAYSLGMAAEGGKIVIADVDLAAAEVTAREIQAGGGEAIAVRTDISSVKDTIAMVEKSVERFSGIDVLVANAGMLERNRFGAGTFWEIDIDDWDKVIDVNLKGTFLSCRAVFPYMKARKSGKIITVSSGAVFFGGANLPHYIASKMAIIGLTRAMAREAGEFNINVNCIAPGATQSWGPEDGEAYESRQKFLKTLLPKRALKRVQIPEDLVGTAIFLASADSDFITGQTIIVDGGEVMN
jgi:3-oxoacyl-[acyl-carrier protein] reductase